MAISKTIARKIVFPAMTTLNLDSLIRKRSKNSLLNILYHGVVNTDSTHIFQRHFHKDLFERQMKFFSKKFNIISIEEAFEMYQNGIKPDSKTITVSFDDGFENNLTTAFPIFEKYKIKTTIFISGICVENENHLLWSEILVFARFFTKEDYIVINDIKFKKIGRYGLFNNELKYSAFDYVKSLPYGDRDRIIEEVNKTYKISIKIGSMNSEYWKLMNSNQIKQLSQSELVTIGSHAYKHFNLSNINVENAIFELRHSKELLENTINKEINMIAYPDGSYNDEIKNEAEKIGYKYQLAGNYICKTDKDDLRIMPRYGLSSTTTYESNIINLSVAFNKNGVY